VSVKAAVVSDTRWTIAQMAAYLGLDNAQVFRAMRQATNAQLLVAEPRKGRVEYLPHRAALLELLIHGLKYMMVPTRGRVTRGMPTAHAAPVMSQRFPTGADQIPVWPIPEGTVRGESFEPLHRCVPFASVHDRQFYDAMALVDAIRGGRARERAIAATLLAEVISASRK